MLLAIDVGNTTIVFGVHDGTAWTHHWRVQTVRERLPDEYAVMFRTFLSEAGLALGVQLIASAFGGGGHLQAAGAKPGGSFIDAVNAVKAEAEKYINDRASAAE